MSQVLGIRANTAMQWGIDYEEEAVQEYVKFQHANGHSGLFVTASGIHISTEHPYLGASPDGSV